ncbi:MAG: hypothetical protein JWO30_4461 [Fibrobacteres bacterium]|nr:hypothetical protein [Fibrobacterota bacterium]
MPDVETIPKLKSHWFLFVLRGAVAILFGIAILASPSRGLAALVYLFGIYAIGDGIFAIFLGAPKRFGLIVAGIIGILAGIAAFAMPVLTAVTLVYVVAAWGILLGGAQLFDAIWGGEETGVDWLMLLAGLSAILLGAIILARPGWGLLYVVVASGIYAIASGIWFISMGIRIHGVENRIRDHGRILPA